MIQLTGKSTSTADLSGLMPAESRKIQGASDADFTAELMGAAGLLAQPGVQQQPVKASGEQALRESSAEKSPLTMKPAVSLNTAAVIAGPKPWSREWVFEGIDTNHAEMKPLLQQLQGDASAEELEMLQKAAQELIGKRADLAKGSDQVGAESLRREVSADMAGIDAELQKLDPKAELSMLSGDAGPVKGQMKPASSSGLSGSEFLSTLSAVRGQDARQNQSQMGGNGNGGQSGRKAGLESGLRVIEGGLKSRKSAFEEDLASVSLKAGGLQGQPSVPTQLGGVKTGELTGHVVPGAMSQDQLSSESLLGLSTGIRNVGTGGEIRMRLNPGHLGELHLRVTTQGSQVGLQIQASDDKARKIIEESIGFLKESLATHQLSLGQVDVSVNQAGSPQGSDSQQQQHQQQAGSFSDFTGQNSGNRNGQNAWSGEGDGGSQRMTGFGPARAEAAVGASSAASVRARSTASSGRLDVMA